MEMSEAHEFEPGAYGVGPGPVGEFELPDPSCTVELGETLGAELETGDFVGLIGPLGSGKTSFVSALVGELGGETPATSPTYTLVNRYATTPEIVHVDLYRLESIDGLETIGYWDYLGAGEFAVCVEWLDRLPGAWPGSGFIVRLGYREKGREVEIWASESFRGRASAVVESFGGDR